MPNKNNANPNYCSKSNTKTGENNGTQKSANIQKSANTQIINKAYSKYNEKNEDKYIPA